MKITKTGFISVLLLWIIFGIAFSQQDTTFTIDNTGKVGIGTTKPVEKLDIDAESNIGIRIGSSGYGSLIRFDRDKDQYTFFTGIPDATNSRWDIQDAYNNPLVSVQWEGNVGIGTSEPNNLLTLHKNDDIWHLALGNVIEGGDQLRLGVPSDLGYAAIGAFNTLDNSGPIHLVLQRDGGHVGIGITNPTATLHIGSGGIRFPDGSYQTSATVGSVGSLSNNLDATVTADADGDGSGALRLQVAGDDKIHINNSGNVGIGTDNPESKLEIRQIDNTTALRIESGSPEDQYFMEIIPIAPESGVIDYKFTTNRVDQTIANDVLTLTQNGRVGIGLTNPAAKLHVYDPSSSGEIRLTGDIASAEGAIHNSLNFYRRNGMQPHARIVTVQNGADNDQVGLAFYTHSSGNDNEAPNEVLRIDNNGNLGIATTEPDDKLEIVDTRTNSTSSHLLGLRSLSTHSDGDARLRFKLRSGSGDDILGEIIADKVHNTGLSYLFRTNDGDGVVNAVRIWDNGNVGIGVDTGEPRFQLSVGSTHNGMYTSDDNFIVQQGHNSARALALNSVGDIWLNLDSNNNNLDNRKLVIAKNDTLNSGIPLVTILEAGNVGIGTEEPTAMLDISSTNGYNQFRLRTSYTPSNSADSNGNIGDFSWDDNFIYVKTNDGWKRAALSTW